MKKIQKIAIILAAFIIIFVATLNYIFQQITPKPLNQSGFPLHEKWSLCVDDHIIDVSSDENGKILVKTKKSLSAYDSNSGSQLWIFPINVNSHVNSFPSITTKEQVFISGVDYLWALDSKSGKKLWEAPLDFRDNNTKILDASKEFVLLNRVSGYVYVYDAISGDKLWEAQGARGYTEAYIDHDKIYIVDDGIKAFDAGTGNPIWELNNHRPTGLSIFDGEVIYYKEYMEYFGDGSYDLVAYNVKTKKELWRINFAGDSAGLSGLYTYGEFLFMTDNSALYQTNPENGLINWKKGLSDSMDLSFIGETVYVFEKFHRVIHALDIESGKELGSLLISSPRVLGFVTQEMVSTGINLAFSRGCEVFIYGD